MAITFTSSAVTILDGNYTFEDIYQASVDAGNQYCKKLGNAYLISIDVFLGDESTPTTLTGQNISVTIEGDLFQITKESQLLLGTINQLTGSTSNGVYLSCPNIMNAYGFGSSNRIDGLTQSGDIFIYDSFIDIYGFWGFFSGPLQHCEVIDCLVNGFGRIEGSNSVLENITTQASHGRYGVLTAKGTIKTLKNISSKSSNEYKGHTCSVYFNPAYAPNMRVLGGTYDGYTEGLVFFEKNATGVTQAGDITFVDSDIRNGFGGYYTDDNTQMLIAYTFTPKFIDENNNTMSDVQVTITNDQGAEVFNGTSVDGIISTELLYHQEDKNGSNDYLFYDVTATKGELSVTRRYRAGITYENIPFFVVAGGGNSTDECCLEDIQAQMDAMQAALFTKIDEVEGTTINHIDDSINDSHDKYKIHANGNKDSIINIVVNGDGSENGTSAKIDRLIEMSEGNYKVINNQMIFFKRDGEEFLRYNLLDDNGEATMVNAYERSLTL